MKAAPTAHGLACHLHHFLLFVGKNGQLIDGLVPTNRGVDIETNGLAYAENVASQLFFACWFAMVGHA